MTKLLTLFRTPSPKPRPSTSLRMHPAIGRSLRGLSVANRLDLSLALGRCDARLFAFGY
jgi:hypothetical protein